MLEVAREKLAVLGRPGTSAVAFDLVNDPPLTPPFDLAISQLVLHHLEDTAAALRGPRRRCCGPAAGSRCRTSTPRTGASTTRTPRASITSGSTATVSAASRRLPASPTSAFRTAHVYENERGSFPLFLLTATRT